MKEIETAEAAAMVSVLAAAVMAAEIEDGVERQFAHSMASCRLIAHGHCLYHAIIAPRVAHPNQAMFLLRELEYEFMHMNAS